MTEDTDNIKAGDAMDNDEDDLGNEDEPGTHTCTNTHICMHSYLNSVVGCEIKQSTGKHDINMM